MTTRIAILDDYQGRALDLADWALLKNCELVPFTMPAADEAELLARLRDFDVVVAMRERTRLGRSVLAQLPRLKLIACTGLRNNAIDRSACADLGIVASGAAGGRNGLATTAETAWALLLALSKRVVESHQHLQEGRWQAQLAQPLVGRTLGLIGLGNIGGQMARIGQAFGMDVIAWSANLSDERAQAAGVRRVSQQVLLESADVVSLHLALADSTRGTLGERELALMKPSAILINTARAELVDEPALRQALTHNHIAGAGLDVFWQEPLPHGHWLLALDNVVLTPHLGYVTEENLRSFYANVLKNIQRWLAGEAPTPLAA
jgi:phosphoglycerate dehydrogenase-like enzyme